MQKRQKAATLHGSCCTTTASGTPKTTERAGSNEPPPASRAGPHLRNRQRVPLRLQLPPGILEPSLGVGPPRRLLVRSVLRAGQRRQEEWLGAKCGSASAPCSTVGCRPRRGAHGRTAPVLSAIEQINRAVQAKQKHPPAAPEGAVARPPAAAQLPAAAPPPPSAASRCRRRAPVRAVQSGKR